MRQQTMNDPRRNGAGHFENKDTWLDYTMIRSQTNKYSSLLDDYKIYFISLCRMIKCDIVLLR